MDEQDAGRFPPLLIVGNRVWTDDGYPNHGPMEGPKVDIAPNQGGTITEIGHGGHFTTGSTLYSVRWDNGQTSKHYRIELLCIGRFQTRAEFEATIKLKGPVELTLGPGGGFRNACFELEYDGQLQKAILEDERMWRECVEPVVRRSRRKIKTTKLPLTRRKA